MKTVNVGPNQTVFDLAVQHYGTAEAVSEIIANNPDIANDKEALTALGIDTYGRRPFRIDVAVKPGFALKIDETSKLIQEKITKKIDHPVTTYQTWQELSTTSNKQ